MFYHSVIANTRHCAWRDCSLIIHRYIIYFLMLFAYQPSHNIPDLRIFFGRGSVGKRITVYMFVVKYTVLITRSHNNIDIWTWARKCISLSCCRLTPIARVLEWPSLLIHSCMCYGVVESHFNTLDNRMIKYLCIIRMVARCGWACMILWFRCAFYIRLRWVERQTAGQHTIKNILMSACLSRKWCIALLKIRVFLL